MPPSAQPPTRSCPTQSPLSAAPHSAPAILRCSWLTFDIPLIVGDPTTTLRKMTGVRWPNVSQTFLPIPPSGERAAIWRSVRGGSGR
jgi:hypothetical protein